RGLRWCCSARFEETSNLEDQGRSEHAIKRRLKRQNPLLNLLVRDGVRGRQRGCRISPALQRFPAPGSERPQRSVGGERYQKGKHHGRHDACGISEPKSITPQMSALR